MSSAVVSARAISAVRIQTLKAAKSFSDYNFRSYFVRHTKDRFNTFDVSKATPAELSAFYSESRDALKQMRRMALMNTMYAQQKVLLDPRAPPMKEEDYNAHAAPKAADADD